MGVSSYISMGCISVSFRIVKFCWGILLKLAWHSRELQIRSAICDSTRKCRINCFHISVYPETVISFKIKAREKNNHRHIPDILRIIF